MEYSKIIIPSSLHPDTILGIFLLKEFGESKYPGIKHAQIEIRQALQPDENAEKLLQNGVIVLDLGKGNLDHHGKANILSELIVEDLGITDDPALAKLLAYAKRDDQYGIGTISSDKLDRAFGLSGIISTLNKTIKDHETILKLIFPILQAHYIEEKKRIFELPKEFEEYLKKGKAEITEINHKDKKLKVVFLESDNISMPGWIKSSIGLKADVVVMLTGSGYVNILTRQKRMIDLRWLAAYLRNEEFQFRERNIPHSIHDLMRQGKIDTIPEWYYDRATNSILNGGVNPKGIEPTIIPFSRIKAIVKTALEKDIPGN